MILIITKFGKKFALIFCKNYQCFEKLYQTLERVFHQISKFFVVGLNNSAAPRFFNSLLSVWISDETLFLVFDILHETDFFLLSILLEKKLF